MKTFRLTLLLFIVAFYSCTKSGVELPDPGDGNGTGSGGSFGVDKVTALQLVNNVRQTGCNCGSEAMPPVPPVTWNDQLAQAAFDHSRDMNTNNYFSHTGLDGSNAGDRIRRAGYMWRAYGENIAKGYANEQAVIQGWLNSPGHCRNIMDPAFREMGMGRSGTYWTQELASK